MAKKKDEGPGYLKDLVKKYGDVIITGSRLLEQKKDYKIVSISPAIDLALNGGIREGSWLILSGAPKSGKAQPYSSTVYTPKGPMLMGDVVWGTEVLTPSGRVAKVTAVFPQGTVDVYKVNFSDGTSARCDLNHLWQVKKNSPKAEWVVKSVEQLEIDLLLQDRNKWMVPLVDVLEFLERPVEIPAQLMGVLLADGALSGREIKISTKDVCQETMDNLNERGCFLSTYNSIQTLEAGIENSITTSIKNYGLKVKRSEKFIPDDYKYNTSLVRTQLLKSMIACNGHYNKTGYLEYTTCSRDLAQDMADVARSLGMIAKVKIKNNSFRVTFHGERLSLIFDTAKNPVKNCYRTIVSIQRDGLERCQCIKIDDEDHLYVTDHFITTHNTTTAMQLAYNCQQEGRPVIYINSEGRLNQMNFDIAGLDPDKMIIVTAENEPLSAETFLDITLRLISATENEGALCIIDSVSSLVASKELDEDVTGSMRPGLPKILSNFTRKAGQIVPNTKTIMCLVTHLITNTSGFGAPRNADGGVKIQFQSDTRMEVKSIAPWEQSDKQVGQAVNWKIWWSGLGATGAECQSWLKFGEGIDAIQEILILGQEAGLISKAGAWITCDFLMTDLALVKELTPDVDIDNIESVVKACKVQGQEKLYNFVKSNPKVYELLKKSIKEML